MPRTHDSLAYAMRKRALYGIKGNTTTAAYKRAVRRFAAWSKQHSIKRLEDVTADVLQRYTDDLCADTRSYSAATVHTYLAPICKAAGVPMDHIRKPKRRAGTITRGRTASANKQGQREAGETRYARLMDLQRAVGLRRAELGRLTVSDLVETPDGLYVHVRRGKGGKEQMQRVLPDDAETVRRIFAGIEPEQRVFSAAEMSCRASLHSIRAEHARRAYDYYAAVADRDALRDDLMTRWVAGHERLHSQNPDAWARQKARFERDMRADPYVLRGDNRQRAENEGLPVEYDRLALMAVSIYELSHWRLDVTVTNYML